MSERADLDGLVARVASGAAAWAALDDGQRLGLLRACIPAVRAAADAWVEAACRMKGAEAGGVVEAEERLTGPTATLRHLRLYADTLERGGELPRGMKAEQRRGGAAVQVFPRSRFDALIYTGLRAEVLLPAGESLRPWPRAERAAGGVAVVLGAGNVSSIPMLDALWQLVAERRGVVVKLHPVMAGLQPALERAFAPLMAGGFLVFTSGGHEDGAALASHPRVAAVHLTGSGRAAEALLGRAPGEGILPEGRPFTAELGAVTPVLVVPGPWSKADLRHQARSVAGMIQVNGGLNCLTPKLLLTAASWPQRGRFLAELRKALDAQPPRAAWYPGFAETREAFRAAVGTTSGAATEATAGTAAEATAGTAAEASGRADIAALLVEGMPPEPGHPALVEEFLGPQLVECALSGDSQEAFLAAAVRFVNEEVYGTLSCTVLAPPHTPRAALDAAVDGLRYGTVAVNTWAALGFLIGDVPWQAFPGATREDPQSGFGTVHHAHLFADPVKTVLRAPFRPGLPPLWMRRARGQARLARALQDYEAAPGLGRFLRVAAGALSG